MQPCQFGNRSMPLCAPNSERQFSICDMVTSLMLQVQILAGAEAGLDDFDDIESGTKLGRF